MQRKHAMAVAATATLVLGGSTVALAASAGAPVLGFGRSDAAEVSTASEASIAQQARRVVTRTKDVLDIVVVDVPEGGTVSSTRAAPIATEAPERIPAARAARPQREAESPFRPRRNRAIDPPPTTDRPRDTERGEPSAPSTSVPATTTTRPRGVPADWPPGEPIPPMPPDCHQPQLEDNGVWNCQDD
jgi:hypothetical protein